MTPKVSHTHTLDNLAVLAGQTRQTAINTGGTLFGGSKAKPAVAVVECLVKPVVSASTVSRFSILLGGPHGSTTIATHDS